MTSFLLTLITYVAFFIAPVTSLNTTKYEIGPGTRMRDFEYASCTGSGAQPNCIGKQSQTRWVGNIPVLANAVGTGSDTVKTTGPDGKAGTKYPAICIPNPFRKMGTGTGKTFFNTGTGTVTKLVYVNVRNPAATAGDIGFVHDCLKGSGETLIANLPTNTGASVSFVPTSTNGTFNGYDFIKLAMSANPTSSFRAQIYVEVLGMGEKL